MHHLLRSTIVLIVSLALFYNVERLDINTENSLNIETFVYLWGAIAVISVISFRLPFSARYHFYLSLLLWVGGYLALKALFFGRNPLLGDPYLYLTITEVALLTILIFVAHHFASNFNDFEQAVQNISFTSSRIQNLETAAERIQDEMFRSRHYQHSLSVIVVEPESASIQASINRVVQEVQQKMMTRYILTGLGKMLKDELRRIDLVVNQPEKGRFIILCPEAEAEELRKLITHIQISSARQLGLVVACGTATFPGEGVTFDGLIEKAEQKLQGMVGPNNYSSKQSLQVSDL